ncbi:MAG: hypothetical protein U0231_04310 [Nitrospiraceae bacterium]
MRGRFRAALAIWRSISGARFQPVKHGEPPPADLGGERVVIVDFSYTRPTLAAMAKEADALIVLDHRDSRASPCGPALRPF